VTALVAACSVSAPGVAGPLVLPSPTWSELSPADREILAPLAPEWNQWDSQRKQKWLGIAKRYPGLNPTEQQRVQQQMHAWAQLTPAERQVAREQYKSMKQLPPERREEVRQKWQEYQQLPPEKRRELATTRAGPPGAATPPPSTPATVR
jgi:hypothetical protein